MKKIFISLFGFIYLQVAFPQDFTTSNLPLIFINTNGWTIPDEPKIKAKMQVINNSNGINHVNDTDFEYNGYIGIEVRGNTAQFFQKRSYSLETRTDSGTNLNVSLLDLPKENDWVLHGPYSDKSLMRNALAYHLGNSTGRWSPRTKFCEVFLNDNYKGVYVLTERIKIDKNRVNIATLKPEDNSGDEITGGYILRIDRHREGSWISPYKGWTGTSVEPISYFDPKYDELTSHQRAYIKNYITNFEHALHGTDFKDPLAGYRPYINVISFIDYYFITELSRDLDGYRCSVYFHKDKDSKGGKLDMSPMWDYNLGFGNGNFMDADKTAGWVVEGIGSGDGYEPVFWFERLREDPYFNTLLKYRWNELRSDKFSEENIYAFIDSCANLLDDAQRRNFEKFDVLEKWVWPNAYIGGTYPNEVDYLKSWISARLGWLDSQIDLIVPLATDELITEFSKNQIQIRVYPNPFTESITIDIYLSEASEVELMISNVLGQEIIHQDKFCEVGLNEFMLTRNDFITNENMYIYSIVLKGEVIQSGKLVKY